MLGIFWLMKVKDPMHHQKLIKRIDYIHSSGGGEPLGCKGAAETTFAQIKTVAMLTG